jgi:hypothetical protein
MRIKLTEGNEAKIQAAIGKVLTHGTSLRQMQDFAFWAERDLEKLGLPKNKRAGAKVSFRSGEKVANSYKWDRKTHRVTLERGNIDWYLIQCYETAQRPVEYHKRDLYLTQKQCDYVLHKVRRQFSVIVEKEIDQTVDVSDTLPGLC